MHSVVSLLLWVMELTREHWLVPCPDPKPCCMDDCNEQQSWTLAPEGLKLKPCQIFCSPSHPITEYIIDAILHLLSSPSLSNHSTQVKAGNLSTTSLHSFPRLRGSVRSTKFLSRITSHWWITHAHHFTLLIHRVIIGVTLCAWSKAF
jgi:hypothetical protein